MPFSSWVACTKQPSCLPVELPLLLLSSCWPRLLSANLCSTFLPSPTPWSLFGVVVALAACLSCPHQSLVMFGVVVVALAAWLCPSCSGFANLYWAVVRDGTGKNTTLPLSSFTVPIYLSLVVLPPWNFLYFDSFNHALLTRCTHLPSLTQVASCLLFLVLVACWLDETLNGLFWLLVCLLDILVLNGYHNVLMIWPFKLKWYGFCVWGGVGCSILYTFLNSYRRISICKMLYLWWDGTSFEVLSR